MRVLTVFCHPDHNSFSGALLERFVAGAEAAGHEVEIADLYREGFDPVMRLRDLQQFDGVEMPPEILAEQARIEQCDALGMIFPLWWWSLPAMLKGWLDRVWSAGWAYQWEHDPEGSLLRPRPCTLLVPAGASAKMMSSQEYDKKIELLWRYGILDYCGIEPSSIHLLLDSAWNEAKRAEHLETAYRAGFDCMLGTEQGEPG